MTVTPCRQSERERRNDVKRGNDSIDSTSMACVSSRMHVCLSIYLCIRSLFEPSSLFQTASLSVLSLLLCLSVRPTAFGVPSDSGCWGRDGSIDAYLMSGCQGLAGEQGTRGRCCYLRLHLRFLSHTRRDSFSHCGTLLSMSGVSAPIRVIDIGSIQANPEQLACTTKPVQHTTHFEEVLIKQPRSSNEVPILAASLHEG